MASFIIRSSLLVINHHFHVIVTVIRTGKVNIVKAQKIFLNNIGATFKRLPEQIISQSSYSQTHSLRN